MSIHITHIIRLHCRILLMTLLFIQSVVLQAESGSDSADLGVKPEIQPTNEGQIVNLPEFPPLQKFDEVIQRPLFISSRRPTPKSAGTTGGNEQVLREAWKLTGITITSEQVLALFQERNGTKRLRLEVGMPLDDHWQLEEVDPDGVSLISGDQVVRLKLRQPREPLPASPAGSKAPAKKATGNDSTASGSKRTPTLKSVPRAGKIQTM